MRGAICIRCSHCKRHIGQGAVQTITSHVVTVLCNSRHTRCCACLVCSCDPVLQSYHQSLVSFLSAAGVSEIRLPAPTTLHSQHEGLADACWSDYRFPVPVLQLHLSSPTATHIGIIPTSLSAACFLALLPCHASVPTSLLKSVSDYLAKPSIAASLSCNCN